MGVTVYLFMIVPKGFLPNEDTGRFNINTEAAEGISFDDMVRHQLQLAEIVMAEPDVAGVSHNVGMVGNNATSSANAGRFFVELTPRDKRTRSVEDVIASLRPKLAQVPGIRAFPANPPAINLGGGGNRPIYQFTLQDADTTELYKWAPRARAAGPPDSWRPGRQQRPASRTHRRWPWTWIATSCRRSVSRQPGGERAPQCLRRTTGDADLRAEQSVPGGTARGA